ncbi:MAG: MFS transporter [Gemmataceae bacterium]|nr:MFS transporter [Gemmataceae bacterium]
MIARLSLLMFLAFAIMGAWIPVLSPNLDRLGYQPKQTAWIFASNALAALIAPLFWSQVADRWIPAERCICFGASSCAVLLWIMASIEDVQFLFWMSFAFWFFLLPTLSLSSALAFRHLPHPEKQFGKVRVWGTIGWISAGLVLSAWLSQPTWMRLRMTGSDKPADLGDSMRLGAVFAAILALHALTLPSTPPSPSSASATSHWIRRFLDAPLRATTMFRRRSFAVYVACMFFLYVTWPFNLQLTSLLIQSLGVEKRNLSSVLAIAQTTEVLTLVLLPRILIRFGQKGTMTLGLLSWVSALVAFSIGKPLAFVAPSMVFHGLYISCFLVAGQVFVNRIAQHDFRASAQGMMLVVQGMGLFIGNIAVGFAREWAGENIAQAYLPPLGITILLTVLFVTGFRSAGD